MALAPLEKDRLDDYVSMMEDVYRFVMDSMDAYSAPHDYGTGDILNMVEVHTLSAIADAPGLCVTDVAKMWNRTLGAASRNVNRLCAKGLVKKEKLPGNDKTVHIYPTEQGARLARLHREFDRTQIAKVMEFLLSRHTEEEFRQFHSVVRSCAEMYEGKRLGGAFSSEG